MILFHLISIPIAAFYGTTLFAIVLASRVHQVSNTATEMNRSGELTLRGLYGCQISYRTSKHPVLRFKGSLIVHPRVSVPKL